MKYGAFDTKEEFLSYCREQGKSKDGWISALELNILLDMIPAPAPKSGWILSDGQKVFASSASELVRIMHANSRTPAADDIAYMLDVADRTVIQDGGKLRTSSAEAFVNDLVWHGFIKRAS